MRFCGDIANLKLWEISEIDIWLCCKIADESKLLMRIIWIILTEIRALEIMRIIRHGNATIKTKKVHSCDWTTTQHSLKQKKKKNFYNVYGITE